MENFRTREFSKLGHFPTPTVLSKHARREIRRKFVRVEWQVGSEERRGRGRGEGEKEKIGEVGTYGLERGRGNLAGNTRWHDLHRCFRERDLEKAFADLVGESGYRHFERVPDRRYLSRRRRCQLFQPPHVKRPPFLLLNLRFNAILSIDLRAFFLFFFFIFFFSPPLSDLSTRNASLSTPPLLSYPTKLGLGFVGQF